MLLRTLRFLITLFIFLFLGCQKSIPLKGMWAGTTTGAGNKQLPFQLFLDLQSAPPAGYFCNGYERTPIPEIQLRGDSLSLHFSEYGAAMLGIWNGKEWRGGFFRYRSDTSRNEFIASPIEAAPTQATTLPIGISLVGKYQAYIPGKDGVDSTTIASFWIQNDSLYGTLIAPDGDYGLFVGTQQGSTATLARFTGWQAFVMELELQETIWNGSLYARIGKPMQFRLVPRASAVSSSAQEHLTTMKNPKAPFTFLGTTMSGQLISSTDDRFKGKALLLDIMGTWCHNCMDAAPLLQQLYSEFGKDGIEVVGLAFEISDSPDLAKKNLSLFQQRYGLTYPLIFCGSTQDANVELKLRNQLDNFAGYPTTILVNNKGLVEKIHVGFKGPGTGEAYQEQVHQYYDAVKHLIN